MAKKVLVVDDEKLIVKGIRFSLEQDGMEVDCAYDGEKALECAKNKEYDMILLDLMLPGLTGEELLPCLGEIPVIVVSAKVGVDDKVNALLTGAADYVSKPFAMRELLARIAVQLRGPRGEEVPCLAFEDLMLDPAARQVTVGGVPVHLTRTEYALCHLLLQNPGRVLSKSAILERISRDTPDCTENSLKTHVSNLRGKLRDVSGRDYVEAVWGIGFRLNAGS